jgi:hypothetical protein
VNGLNRLLAAVVLVALLLPMGVHYSTSAGEHWPYPSGDDIQANNEQYVGQETFLFGTVLETRSDTGVIRVETDIGSFNATVRGFDADAQQGGVVQVVGTVRPNYVIDASNVRVVNPAGASKLYKYVVSLVGAALVVVAFFRHWRVNLAELSFEVRSDG